MGVEARGRGKKRGEGPGEREERERGQHTIERLNTWCAREHARTHTPSHKHTHKRAHKHTQIHSLTLARSRAHAHAHKYTCTHTHTQILLKPAGRANEEQSARPTQSDTASTSPRAHAPGAKTCACIARACLACVRRPEVLHQRLDARLCQGDTLERRVVLLQYRCTVHHHWVAVTDFTPWVAAHLQPSVQSGHTATRMSTTRRCPPRITPATIPEVRRLDRSPHS